MRKLKNRVKNTIKASGILCIPAVLIGGCIALGTKDVKTVEKTDFTSTIANTATSITYTSLTLYTNVTSTVTTTNIVTRPIFKTYEEPLATEINYTPESSYYNNWDMYGNYMPTENGDYIYVDSNLLNYIYNECEHFGVPYELALATCYVESGFTANINNEGLNTDGSIDYGIMGLNGNYLMDNCMKYNGSVPIDPYNAYENVHIGIQILADNLEYFGGSIWDASNAYNLGIGGWEDINYTYGYWYYGEKILNYIDLLCTM